MQLLRKKGCRAASLTLAAVLTASAAAPALNVSASAEDERPVDVILRVCNWEEYIDEGDWDEEETIDLDSGDIIGENHMAEDFEEWYYETYGIGVKVEYSTFGTNEDLYNMLTLGDEYDVVCPSEYMFMKLIAEDMAVPLSDEFFDTENEYNYYINNVSPYINEIFQSKEIDGQAWGQYAAGYMFGVTGIVYNPDEVDEEDVKTWDIFNNPDYHRQVTIKDNVRDSYFMAVGALKHDLLTSDEFTSDPDYLLNLEAEMNDVSPETIQEVQDYLQDVKDNAYSFETDAGKADMITGKVVANCQWSGDAVYTLDQAEEDDYYLNFSVPDEVTNIYFDGWIMLKNGIRGDEEKQKAAEAFINFVSRPDNAIRNMYYIGYTSVIAGNEDDQRIFEYAEWNYSAEDDEEEVVDYPLGWFFAGDAEDEDYVIEAPAEQMQRQLYAQYPPADVVGRASIMIYFDKEANANINQMWINVRCFNIHDVPAFAWVLAVLAAAGGVWLLLDARRKKKMYV